MKRRLPETTYSSGLESSNGVWKHWLLQLILKATRASLIDSSCVLVILARSINNR